MKAHGSLVSLVAFLGELGALGIFDFACTLCLIGTRTELNIRLLQERYAESGEVGIYAWLRADVAFLHDASFCINTVTL